MSTSNSPLWKLQAEARRMARHLKQPGVLPPNKAIIKFGIVMDDKTITIDMARQTIVDTAEDALADMIVEQMKATPPG
jgi:hypothetical protein